MTREENIKIYEKFIKFLQENNIELISCSCCDGIGIEINNQDMQIICICNNQDIIDNLQEIKLKKGDNNE